MIGRRDFVKLCAALGVSAPLLGCSGALTHSVDPEVVADGNAPLSRKVLIIGAGAAGMAAGHLLAQRGIDFTILEAAPTHGGRMKTTSDFVDFPIPLGGEWLHVAADELDRIVDDKAVSIETETVPYLPTDEIGTWDGERLTIEPMGEDIDPDLKFVGATWLDFFDEYVVPGIADRMVFDTQVVEIDHSGETIVATDATGVVHEADALIATTSIEVIRRGDLAFTPPFPDDKSEAFGNADVWGGMKVFLEFSERFFPTFVELPDSYTGEGQRLFYDAAHGQDTDSHVLGLFSVGAQAEPYQALDSGDALRDHVLAELDEMFDGAATRTYMQHVAQNWSDEPFVHQAYLSDVADERTPRLLAEPIDGRVFFAGEAYTDGDDWGGVHDATQSARLAVEQLLA